MQYIVLIAFFVVFIIIAIFGSRKTKTLEDFFLGGRQMGPWMSAMAYGATYFSAVMFIGYAGNFGWKFGISVIWLGIGNAILGSLVPWMLMAKATRNITQKLSVSTMPEFFEKRYQSRPIKIISAIIIFVFLVPYCASVYQGLSYFFESMLGNLPMFQTGFLALLSPYQWCMILMAIVTALYLTTGGYVATAISSLFQSLVMVVGVVFMLAYILGAPQVEGVASGLNKLAEIDPSLANLFGSPQNLIALISLVLLTSVGSWGMPQMLHKFYSIKDERAIKSGTIISMIFCLLIAGGGYFAGSFGRLFLGNQMPASGDMVMPQVLSIALPGALLGLIGALLLAASMSTLSSLVLVSSSSIAMDLVKGAIKPKMSEKSTIGLMRILCIFFVLFSLIVALDQNKMIFTLMSFSWGSISGAFLAPFLLGVRWKRVTKAGAYAGIISGLVINLSLNFMGISGLTAPMIGCIAMASSFIITVAVSLLTKRPPQELLKIVFEKAQ